MQPRTAHLKTLREETGLTVNEAADLAGVAIRTWKYWESPTSTTAAKPDVFEALHAILDVQDAGINAVLEAHDSIPEGETMLLTRYRTQDALDRHHPGFPGGLNAHSAMISRAFRELHADDRNVVIVWDDDPAAVIGQDYA